MSAFREPLPTTLTEDELRAQRDELLDMIERHHAAATDCSLPASAFADADDKLWSAADAMRRVINDLP